MEMFKVLQWKTMMIKKKKKADKTQDPFGVQIVQWICIL